MEYFSGKMREFVKQTVAKLRTNDDLYDELVRLMDCQKEAGELERLINDLAYTHVAVAFRRKKLKGCKTMHGRYHDSYAHPYEDAKNQMLNARDRLMRYCEQNEVDYFRAYCW